MGVQEFVLLGDGVGSSSSSSPQTKSWSVLLNSSQETDFSGLPSEFSWVVCSLS